MTIDEFQLKMKLDECKTEKNINTKKQKKTQKMRKNRKKQKKTQKNTKIAKKQKKK